MSLLCRAHRDTGRDIYLECAQYAFRSLMLDVKILFMTVVHGLRHENAY